MLVRLVRLAKKKFPEEIEVAKKMNAIVDLRNPHQAYPLARLRKRRIIYHGGGFPPAGIESPRCCRHWITSPDAVLCLFLDYFLPRLFSEFATSYAFAMRSCLLVYRIQDQRREDESARCFFLRLVCAYVVPLPFARVSFSLFPALRRRKGHLHVQA